MAYMGHRYGDYLGGYAGDPGFFSKLLKIGGKIVGSFLGVGGPAPTPSYLAPPPQYRTAGMSLGGPRGLLVGPGVGARQTAFVGTTPRAKPFVTPGLGGPRLDPRTGLPMKRRRMNVANPKALRRATRRTAGFVKLARRSLRGTGYRIVSASSRRPQIKIQEAGAGSVTVQK